MRLRYLLLLALLAGCTPQQSANPSAPRLRVGSKQFTEGVILGELVADLARSAGARADHRETRGLGSTRVLWNALLKGEIDIYPEYTGTIVGEIFADKGLRGQELLAPALGEHGIRMSRTLGFNNTYAVGMRKETAARLGIGRLSDLRSHPDLKFGFSNEFMERADGWPGLRERYRLPQKDVRGLDHELAYRGLVNGTLDATDLYSTDAKIRQYDLQVLGDDLQFFPAYQAVLLYRRDLQDRAPAVLAAILKLEGAISEADMVDMNARVDLDKVSEEQVAADFLSKHFALDVQAAVEGSLHRFLRVTAEHLFLVAISLGAAILIAVPLGILAAKWSAFGQFILASAGMIQTIPSMALLVFMISLLGIGAAPAIAALFLYSLLPIVRNTYTGLNGIPVQVRESAEALGLSAAARLRLIDLPLASRTILAGIKTAAVINVGTATLGGFIGAGGYGEVIFAGIRKADNTMTLQGAIPAALLALAVQGLFELAERGLVPRGLRLKSTE
jgi:osmoprotectant transport system permease protein